jgi:hypothetical protein
VAGGDLPESAAAHGRKSAAGRHSGTLVTMSTTPFADDVYQPDSQGQEGERFADLEDALDEPNADDLLDTGYSPPDRQPQGTQRHETLDERLAEEEPDVWQRPDDGDGIGDCVDTDGEPIDAEVGTRRSGRLVAGESDTIAHDVGVDGGAASAEEAAMHIVEDDRIID